MAQSPFLKTMLRYFFFQAAGWAIAAGVLSLVHSLRWISSSTAWVVFAVWVVKDIVLYPLVWKGYVKQETDVREHLVGERAVATSELAPEGFVRVRGELWRARLVENGASRVEPGDALRVSGVKDLLLDVRRESD